jgi:hypothetical protein
MRIQNYPYKKHIVASPDEYLQTREVMAECWRKFLITAADPTLGRPLALWLFQNTGLTLMQLPEPNDIGTIYNYDISREPILHEHYPFTFDEIYRIVIYREIISIPESNVYRYDIERLYQIVTEQFPTCFDVLFEHDFISITIK